MSHLRMSICNVIWLGSPETNSQSGQGQQPFPVVIRHVRNLQKSATANDHRLPALHSPYLSRVAYFKLYIVFDGAAAPDTDELAPQGRNPLRVGMTHSPNQIV